jgi:prolyl-tRNA synthetase
MGCYGIGPGRVMGTIVETLSDEKGIVWPEAVAPFRVHLLSLGQDEEADRIYRELTSSGIETLYDDRAVSAGEKFAESDLIGIPYQVIIGKKTLESGEAEIKRRSDGSVEKVSLEGLSGHFRTVAAG